MGAEVSLVTMQVSINQIILQPTTAVSNWMGDHQLNTRLPTKPGHLFAGGKILAIQQETIHPIQSDILRKDITDTYLFIIAMPGLLNSKIQSIVVMDHDNNFLCTFQEVYML